MMRYEAHAARQQADRNRREFSIACLALTLLCIARPTAVMADDERPDAAPPAQKQSGETGKSPLDAALKGLQEQPRPIDAEPQPTPAESTVSDSPRPGMIRAFLNSWTLFHNTYLAGWLIALALSLVGVLVVARNQIFIGAAVSQASMLGVAAGLWASGFLVGQSWHWLESDSFLSSLAVAASVVAALVTARGGQAGHESVESLTGWVFLICASASILIVSHSPHGLEEVHRLLSSSIIGSTPTDVAVFAALAGLSAVGTFLFGRRLLLFALDPEMATAVGMRTGLWAAVFCVWLGLSVGLSVRASGMLYSFGMLVLPALIAKNICREVRPMLVVSPVLAVAIATVGFVLANYYDFPPAQMTVALACVLLIVAWAVPRIRR